MGVKHGYSLGNMGNICQFHRDLFPFLLFFQTIRVSIGKQNKDFLIYDLYCRLHECIEFT